MVGSALNKYQGSDKNMVQNNPVIELGQEINGW